jgi:hypothetical protein
MMLAKVDHTHIDLTAYWVSEKYDGLRAYWNVPVGNSSEFRQVRAGFRRQGTCERGSLSGRSSIKASPLIVRWI